MFERVRKSLGGLHIANEQNEFPIVKEFFQEINCLLRCTLIVESDSIHIEIRDGDSLIMQSTIKIKNEVALKIHRKRSILSNLGTSNSMNEGDDNLGYLGVVAA